MLNAANCKL